MNRERAGVRRAPERRQAAAAKPLGPVDYKDVNLLRRFISDRGKIRGRRVTGLSPSDQRRVATAIRNAREMALLPYPAGARR